MEICILVKFSTNRIMFLFFVLCSVVFVISCQTATHTDYERPDYTDEQILKNTVDRIIDAKDDNVVYALWQLSILYNETSNEDIKKYYSQCADSAISQFYEHYSNKNWADALLIAQSIITLNTLVEEELVLELESSFFDDVKTAQINYENIPELATENRDNTASMATYISGVVTVWVDLGVKVANGLGYPNRSLGSGFFIDGRGYIITNHHVIEELVNPEYEGYSRLYIKLSNDSETRIPAKVVGWDKTLDLALLKTEITPPYVFTLGTSQNLTIGNPIYAIGSPVGLENTITSGIISAFDRQLLSTASVMQIDAAVNSGNSGGPLIHVNGEVQGIVFAGLATYQGLNFAIPVEYLKAILLRLYSEGEVNHSWMGAYGRTIKRYPTDEKGQGVEVLYVMPGSPAFYADIEVGSIITEIDGIDITSIEDLQYALIQLSPESIVTIETKNSLDADTSSISIYLDQRPEQPGLEIYEREPSYKMVYPLFGMELIPSSVGNKNQYTVQSIVRGSIADESGFSVHDPVEIRKTVLSENKDAVFIETFTKKRKSGYFEVNVAIGSALDSPFLF